MKVTAILQRLREYGFWGSVQVALNRLEVLCFDLRYGVDTFMRVSIPDMEIGPGREAKEHGYKYDASPISTLAAVLRKLEITERDVLVDFGSGKGMALFVAARFPFRRLIGIEFASDLCDVARRNMEKLRRRRPDTRRIEIVMGNAEAFAITAEQTFFYWFNPFDGVTMRRVMDNVRASLQEHPRRMVLIFYHPTCTEVIDTFTEFALTHDLQVRGRHFKVYENRFGTAAAGEGP